MEQIYMPKLSENMKEGTLVSWAKQTGDTVKKGDVLFEIETDKVVYEVEATADGHLASQCYEEGAVIASGETVAVIGE